MSMRVIIQDDANELVIIEIASGDYAPDCMHDLNNRAIGTYQDALSFRAGLIETLEERATKRAETGE
jgi:hypothetical protein